MADSCLTGKGNEDGGVTCPKGDLHALTKRTFVQVSDQASTTGLLRCFRPMIAILRKEVIQPQGPLRLPCYDFTPVADLTVAGCLPCGLAHRLQVKPTPMV